MQAKVAWAGWAGRAGRAAHPGQVGQRGGHVVALRAQLVHLALQRHHLLPRRCCLQ
jgi:hypothetical protein